MVHRKKFDDVIGHVIRQPCCFFNLQKSHLKWLNRSRRNYTYDRLSMRNKRFTHMMSKVTWFGSHIGFTWKPIKKSSSSDQLDRSKGNFTQMFPKPWVYRFVKEYDRSHGVAAILDWRKILNNVFFWDRLINRSETSQLWSSHDGEYMF